MREDDGIWIARKLSGSPAVPDSFEVTTTTILNEIVLTVYRDVKRALHCLRRCWAKRVRVGARLPNVEGVILNRVELRCARKARDVEQLSQGTHIANGSTPFNRLPGNSPVGTHVNVLLELQV